MSDSNKFRQYYHSLVGLIKVFEDTTPKAEDIEVSLVREYERFMDDVNKDLPNMLSAFNKDDYFSFNGDTTVFYRSAGIKAHMQRNLGILKTLVDELSQTPVTQNKSFHFVSDNDIRRILERDYIEIQRNIISLNWKSAILLSGGAIEAILLDLLLRNPSKAKSSSKAPKKSDLDEWDLNDLVEVAVEEKFIGNEIAKLSHTVREYRNLIHPGVEKRKNLKVESEEAKIAVEVLNILIRELS